MLHILFTFALAYAGLPSKSVVCTGLLSTIETNAPDTDLYEARAALKRFRLETLGFADDQLEPYRDYVRKFAVTSSFGPADEVRLAARRLRNVAPVVERSWGGGATIYQVDGTRAVGDALRSLRTDLDLAIQGGEDAVRERALARRDFNVVGVGGLAAAAVTSVRQILILPLLALAPEVLQRIGREVERARELERWFTRVDQVMMNPTPDSWVHLYAHLVLNERPNDLTHPRSAGYRQAVANELAVMRRAPEGEVMTLDLILTNVKIGWTTEPRLMVFVRYGAVAEEVAK